MLVGLGVLVAFGPERLHVPAPVIVGGFIAALLIVRWRLQAEMYWPWGYVGLLFVIAAVVLRFPLLILPLCLCGMAWGWQRSSRRPTSPGLTRKHFGDYLARGGSGSDYLRVCAKVNQAIMERIPRQGLRELHAVATWANLCLIARMCGIGRDELAVLVGRAVGSGEIYESEHISRWRLMRPFRPFFVGAGVLFVMVLVSVWIAIQLSTASAAG